MAGHHLGPLHGIPVALKDLYATRGVATTYGSPLFADWVPDFDAAAVERLKRAGAVILGKTNLHELAYGTHQRQRPLWRGAQSLAAGSSPGRLERRLGGGGRGRPRLCRDGQRHRRLDPPAGRVLRHRRHQADLRPGQQVRRPAAVLVAGPRRPADPQRRRCRAAAPGAGGLRSARSDLGRPAGARLQRRPRQGRPGIAHRRRARLLLR